MITSLSSPADGRVRHAEQERRMVPNGERIPGDQMREIKEENDVRAADLKQRERNDITDSRA